MAKIGKPLKFKSKKELEEAIDNYFQSCFAPAFTKDGAPMIDTRTGEQMIKQIKPFTMAGLASALEVDRKTILNYGNREEYFLTIKKARARIEAYAEEQLFKPQIAAGVIFNLKNNFGWRDDGKNDEDDNVTKKLDEIIQTITEEAKK